MSEEDQNREHNEKEHSFDELAKGLANGSLSRRRALKVMGAAVLGGVLTTIPGIALADPKKPGTGRCQPGEFKCGKKCCPEVASCVQGRCVCPNGTDLVNGQCQAPCPAGESLNGLVPGQCSCRPGGGAEFPDTCPSGTFCQALQDSEFNVVSAHCCPAGTCCVTVTGSSAGPQCGLNGGDEEQCDCHATQEGTTLCLGSYSGTTCTSSSECGTGFCDAAGRCRRLCTG